MKKITKMDFGVFQVGLKLVLRKGGKILFLRDNDEKKSWDWPGGRIDDAEYGAADEKIIAREVREELGPRVKYILGKPAFTLKRWTMRGGKKMCVFCIFYEAEFRSGTIKLSSEHSSYEWISPKTFEMKRADFSHKEEYAAFKKYFEKAHPNKSGRK